MKVLFSLSRGRGSLRRHGMRMPRRLSARCVPAQTAHFAASPNHACKYPEIRATTGPHVLLWIRGMSPKEGQSQPRGRGAIRLLHARREVLEVPRLNVPRGARKMIVRSDLTVR